MSGVEAPSDGTAWVSFAQNGEDVRLHRALRGVTNGYYVEVGGWHPEVDSISRSFSDRGWSGLIVEPVPESAELFRRARPRDVVVECLAWSSEGSRPLSVFAGTGLSTSSPEIADHHLADGRAVRNEQVVCRTLTSILREASPKDIHYMSVDVEGAESEVLAGLDLTLFRPWILVVEATLPGRPTANHEGWEPGVLAKDYLLAAADGLNRFYVAKEHEELQQALVPPPNVFDNFVTSYQANLESRCAELEGRCAELDGRLQDRERQLDTQFRVGVVREQLLLARLANANTNADNRMADLEAIRGRCQELDARRQEMERMISQIESSRSWRVTRPLRAARRRG